jgi:hypothetical protein
VLLRSRSQVSEHNLHRQTLLLSLLIIYAQTVGAAAAAVAAAHCMPPPPLPLVGKPMLLLLPRTDVEA